MKNQAVLDGGLRIVALLRCLFRNRLSPFYTLRATCAAGCLRRGFSTILNPLSTPAIAPGKDPLWHKTVRKWHIGWCTFSNDRMAGRGHLVVHTSRTIGEYRGKTRCLSNLSHFYSRRSGATARRVAALSSHLWEAGGPYALQDYNYSQG